MQKEFSTTDLQLASFLLLKKIRLIGLRQKDGRSFWFTFTNPQQCETLANSFFTGRARVDARAYSEAVRRAKDLIFSQDRRINVA